MAISLTPRLRNPYCAQETTGAGVADGGGVRDAVPTPCVQHVEVRPQRHGALAGAAADGQRAGRWCQLARGVPHADARLPEPAVWDVGVGHVGPEHRAAQLPQVG